MFEKFKGSYVTSATFHWKQEQGHTEVRQQFTVLQNTLLPNIFKNFEALLMLLMMP